MNTSSPLFSIVIPIYNVQVYLNQCINSVLAQHYQQCEIILVNDGSTDNSLAICLEYAAKYKNIMVLSKANGGLADARNYGVKVAKGEYILFLDSDDYWVGDNILNDLEQIISSHNFPDAIFHNYHTFVEQTGELYAHSFDVSGLSGNYEVDFRLLQHRQLYRPNAWTKVVKRTIVLTQPFPFGFIHEDCDYSFNLATKLKTYALYPRGFYFYRMRNGSLSIKTSKRNVIDFLTLIEKNLFKLNTFKQQPIYAGLLNSLKGELNYCVSLINTLTTEEKVQISPLLERCVHLLNLYLATEK